MGSQTSSPITSKAAAAAALKEAENAARILFWMSRGLYRGPIDGDETEDDLETFPERAKAAGDTVALALPPIENDGEKGEKEVKKVSALAVSEPGIFDPKDPKTYDGKKAKEKRGSSPLRSAPAASTTDSEPGIFDPKDPKTYQTFYEMMWRKEFISGTEAWQREPGTGKFVGNWVPKKGKDGEVLCMERLSVEKLMEMRGKDGVGVMRRWWYAPVKKGGGRGDGGFRAVTRARRKSEVDAGKEREILRQGEGEGAGDMEQEEAEGGGKRRKKTPVTKSENVKDCVASSSGSGAKKRKITPAATTTTAATTNAGGHQNFYAPTATGAYVAPPPAAIDQQHSAPYDGPTQQQQQQHPSSPHNDPSPPSSSTSDPLTLKPKEKSSLPPSPTPALESSPAAVTAAAATPRNEIKRAKLVLNGPRADKDKGKGKMAGSGMGGWHPGKGKGKEGEMASEKGKETEVKKTKGGRVVRKTEKLVEGMGG